MNSTSEWEKIDGGELEREGSGNSSVFERWALRLVYYLRSFRSPSGMWIAPKEVGKDVKCRVPTSKSVFGKGSFDALKTWPQLSKAISIPDGQCLLNVYSLSLWG